VSTVKLFIVVIIATAILVTPLSSSEKVSASEACYPNTWGDVVCAPDWINEAVWEASQFYGASHWELMSVAACESNFDPDTYGPYGEVGLFQWMPETWDWIAYGDRWDSYDQIWSSAWAFANGYQSHWTCFYRV